MILKDKSFKSHFAALSQSMTAIEQSRPPKNTYERKAFAVAKALELKYVE